MGAGERAAEVAVAHSLGERDQDGHVLRFAARHHRVDGHVPRGGAAVGGRQRGNHLVPSIVGVFEVFVCFFKCGGNEGETVAPVVFLEIGIYLIKGAVEGVVADVAVVAAGTAVQLLLRDGFGEGFHNLRPQHLAGVADQLFVGVGGERAGVKGHAHHRNAIVVGGIVGLVGEAGTGDDDGRNADIFGGEA